METLIGFIILAILGWLCFFSVSWLTFTTLKWVHKTFFYKPPPNPQSKET